MNISIQDDRKSFRSGFFRMLLVIALQNTIVYGVNLLDNIMLGGYTELALSGVALKSPKIKKGSGNLSRSSRTRFSTDSIPRRRAESLRWSRCTL